ncbi:MAG: hypothetical protein ACK4YP_25665, partial [Myxococcota bacterium]
MPYDIHVFRGDREAPAPLTPAEVLAVLRGTRSPEPDATEWRVWSERTPWFVARLANDVLTLSASYSNPEFLPLLHQLGRAMHLDQFQIVAPLTRAVQEDD